MMTYGEAEVIYKSKSACSATPAPKAAKQQGSKAKTTARTEQLHGNRERQQQSKTKSKNHGNNVAANSLPWKQYRTYNTAKLKLEKAMLCHTYIATPAWQQHSHQHEYATGTIQKKNHTLKNCLYRSVYLNDLYIFLQVHDKFCQRVTIILANFQMFFRCKKCYFYTRLG